jgi:hypothetical protein
VLAHVHANTSEAQRLKGAKIAKEEKNWVFLALFAPLSLCARFQNPVRRYAVGFMVQ